MSGWTGALRAARLPDRFPHEVLFPADYDAEFADALEIVLHGARQMAITQAPDADTAQARQNAPAITLA